MSDEVVLDGTFGKTAAFRSGGPGSIPDSWLFSVMVRPGARCKHCNCSVQLDTKIAVAKAKVFPHLEALVRAGCGIPHANDSVSFVRAKFFLIFYD
jgi:hypothetical protein